MSDALTERQRERMLKTVNKIQTETNMKKRVRQLELRIQSLEKANGIKIYTEAINRVLKKARRKNLIPKLVGYLMSF